MSSPAALLDKLKLGFIHDLPDRIEAIENDVLQLRNSNDFDRDFQEVYRKVHSLKGSGGTYGYPVITTVCHQLEDTLNLTAGQQAKCSDEIIERALAYIDLLRQTHMLIDHSKLDFAEISERLVALQKNFSEDRLRCLVVDGSRMTREMCVQALAPFNVDVIVMDDGYQALGRLLGERFDVLITGVELGILNGLALVSALKLSSNVNKGIKTIVITSSPAQFAAHKREVDPSLVLRKGAGMLDALHHEFERLLTE